VTGTIPADRASAPARGRYDAVWRAAEPYLRSRKNDVHIPISFAYAERLLAVHPEADRDVVLLAIMLHDIGWHAFDMADIVEKGFGPGKMRSDIRVLHEKEGARLARKMLSLTNWPAMLVDAVASIIDGHDTRVQSRSLEDRLVRDADKLWRYTTTGVSVACDWFRKTPHQYADQVETEIAVIETEAARMMATEELARTRAALMLHLI
jgi:HD superfamily phosphodiesterase